MSGVVIPLRDLTPALLNSAELRRAIRQLDDAAAEREVVVNLRAALTAIRTATERPCEGVGEDLATDVLTAAMRAAPAAARVLDDQPEIAVLAAVATEGAGALVGIASRPSGAELPRLLADMVPFWRGVIDVVIERLTERSAPIAPAA